MNRCTTSTRMCRAARAPWKPAPFVYIGVDQGLQPACAEACPNKAILFGDLNDPESEIARKVRSVASVQIRADLQLNPGIRYQGL